MGFKERLKEARLMNNMTQEQVAEKIGVAKSTFTGYEKGNSEPNMITISKIMNVLKIDANYLWQDEADFPMEVSYDEMNHIKKYRDLDDHGKEMVDMVLEGEHARWEAEHKNAQETMSIVREPDVDYLVPDAAHDIPGASDEAKAAADALMDNDEFWKR